MNKLNLFYFLEEDSLKFFLKSPKSYSDSFYELKKYFSSCTIVNFSKIIGQKVCSDNFKHKLKKKNINYLCPSTSKELLTKIKQNNNYAFFKAPFGFKYYRILRTIKKSNIKIIQVSNYSFIFEKKPFQGRSIKQSLRIIFKMKLINYFHRFMSTLGFYPKIFVHFDCDQSRIDMINKSLSKKLDKYIPFLKFSYYKKLVRINSKYYSDFIRSKNNKLEKKFITLCDSPLVHDDFILRDGNYDIEKIEEYYKNLNLFLINIQKKLKKKVIICLHPKGKYNNFKNFKIIEKNFKTVKFKTEYYISKSFLVLNIISSTINYAIMQDKPIIILKSKYLGNTVKGKIQNIEKELNYPSINIDEFKELDLKKVLNKKNINKVDLYKKNKLFFKINTTDHQQVMNYLKNNS